MGTQCTVKIKLNVKVKLFLSPWKHIGNGRISPIILNLGTRCEVNDQLHGPAALPQEKACTASTMKLTQPRLSGVLPAFVPGKRKYR